jgi:hypothetical protein
MRSRAEPAPERVRRLAELVLRAVALAALAALLWRAVQPRAVPRGEAAAGNLTPMLQRWTLSAPAELRVVLDRAPDVSTRDWIRALARAGSAARWSASRPLRPSAVVAEPASEPNGATRVRFAAAGGEPVSIGDAAGMIDTLPRGGPAELELASVAGSVRAAGATYTATTVARDSFALRPVLVIGSAGWESKFTIAALEERGWRVASRVRVAPNVDVTQGPLGAIDTARYSAVVALDSSAAGSAMAIARFAREGGGVILAGAAARMSGVSSIAAGRVGPRVAGVAGAIASASPRSGLGVFPVTSVAGDAVALESRETAVTVAARRVDAGRVVQSGYDETWRWRMAGGDEAAAAHREWWSRLVAAVAYAPLVARPEAPDAAIDETPLASLVDALGPASTFDAASVPVRDGTRPTRFLFALVVGALLLEWASRRLRGVR